MSIQIGSFREENPKIMDSRLVSLHSENKAVGLINLLKPSAQGSTQSNSVLQQPALAATVNALTRSGRLPMGNTKLILPTYDGSSRFVSFDMTVGGLPNTERLGRTHVWMYLYRDFDDVAPMHRLSLTGAAMLTSLYSDRGPTFALIGETGCFNFLSDTDDESSLTSNIWISMMRILNVKILFPSDMYFALSSLPIGSGAFGKVYKMLFRPVGLEVAMKTVLKSPAGTELLTQSKTALCTEIQALRSCTNSCTVKFIMAYEDESCYYLALESLNGCNMSEYLNERGPLSEAVCQILLRRLVLALVEFEEIGLVHRDLKLENLVLAIPGDPTSVKIVDFGLSAFMGSERMKMRCGSHQYAAPEVLKGQEYKSNADVFSLGVLMYAFVSGCMPFSPDRVAPQRESIAYFEEDAWKNVSSDVREITEMMLIIDPNIRPQSKDLLKHPFLLGSTTDEESGRRLTDLDQHDRLYSHSSDIMLELLHDIHINGGEKLDEMKSRVKEWNTRFD